MAAIGGSNIVTNGLVLALDAGNTRSYPGSGTAWTDVSGNGNNGTLVNSPTYATTNGGQFTFNGTNQSVDINNSLVVTAATFITWLRRNGNQASYAGILFSGGTGSTTGTTSFSTTNNLGYHWNDITASWSFNSGLLIPDNTWCMTALSVNSTTATLYVNLQTATNSASHTSTNLSGLRLGVNGEFLQHFFNGTIGATYLYNRALSVDEVTQNYNALRGRFGL